MDKDISLLINQYYQQKNLFDEEYLKDSQEALIPVLKKLKEVKIFQIQQNAELFKESQQEKNELIIHPINHFEEINNQKQFYLPSKIQNAQSQSNLNLINRGSLTKQQLKDIYQNGAFKIPQNDGKEKIWQISKHFFMSQSDMDKIYKTPDFSKLKQLITTKDTEKRIRSKKWKFCRLSSRYFNLKDGLYTLAYDTPLHLLNCLIGVPIFVMKKVKINRYLQGEFIDFQRELDEVKELKIFNNLDVQAHLLNCDFVQLMSQEVQKLEWNKFILQQKSNLDVYLIVECLKQLLSQLNIDINQQKYQQTINNILGIYIIVSFKQKITNKDNRLELFSDCLSFLDYYKLDLFKQKALKIQNVFRKVCLEEEFIEENYKSQHYYRDEYFWKIKFYWKVSFLEIINNLYENIIYGKLGIKVVFCKENKYDQSRTIYEKYQEIKSMAQQRIKKRKEQTKENEDDNDDDGGLFGGCCMRFPCCSYLFIYIIFYFLLGMIYNNIILRLVGIFYILLRVFSLLILCFLNLLLFMFQFTFSIFIFDHSNLSELNIPDIHNLPILDLLEIVLQMGSINPFKSQRNIPVILPIFQIIFFNPFIGVLKIAISLIRIFFFFFNYLALKLIKLPKVLKNYMTFTLIKIFNQVPYRDSTYCKLVNEKDKKNMVNQEKTIKVQIDQIKEKFEQSKSSKSEKMIKEEEIQNKNKTNFCYLSFEQIKLVLDCIINKIYLNCLFNKLKDIKNNHVNYQQKIIKTCLQHLPFEMYKFLNQVQENADSLEVEIKKILMNQCLFKYSIEYGQKCQLFYYKDQLKTIFDQVDNYLQTFSEINQEEHAEICKQLKVYPQNFSQQKSLLLLILFEGQYSSINELSLFQQLTKSYDFNPKDTILSSYINAYLQDNFLQEKITFQDNQLQLFSINLINLFIK